VAGEAHREFLDSAVLARLSRLSLNAREAMLGSVTGIHRSATRGSSVEFAEYRKYVPGDDIRHIDWRVYARTDRFYMKEFEADTNLRCLLLLDTSASMGFAAKHGTKFEYARRLAATLAYLLVHQGDAVGLVLYNDRGVVEIPPRRSPAQLKAVFDALAGAAPQGGTSLVETLHATAEKARRRALVVVISDCFTDVAPLLDGFQHMRFQKHDLAVFHLLDRLEIDFSFGRPMRFADLEGPFQMVTDPAVSAGGYRRALDAYLESISRGSREFGVDYRRVTTDTGYEQVLAAFMLQRLRAGAGGGAQ
jgi:uncharacterized protein (DUF58 family)